MTEYTDFSVANLETYATEYLIEVLRAADDLYYNDHESFISDAEYDAVRLFTQKAIPHHVYFTGIGSEVRGGKIKLPYQMGSLDQVEIGEITDWIGNWGLQHEDIVITDKLDGTSAMVIYDEDGNLQIAYSRGNGVEGADITRHLKLVPSIPKKVSGSMVVRGEMIIKLANWSSVKETVESRSGKEYKNPRNCVAGMMNAKSNPEGVYQYLDFVAYDVLGDESSKRKMLKWLLDEGFKVPVNDSFIGSGLTDQRLAEWLNLRRKRTEYEIDGLVLDVEDKFKRLKMNPTRDTLNPAYAVKYKVADASNQAVATVVDVEWNVSKHGYLKPRVKIEPVDLVGVTIQHATGFNAKFIYDNGIGPGAKIKITRSGDVIPFILDVVEKTLPRMPGSVPSEIDWDWSWNETGVDAVLNNHHESDDVAINQIVDFFASIDAPMLRKGNVAKMYEAPLDPLRSIEDIITAPQGIIEAHLGANGQKVFAGLRKVLTDIPVWKLMGSTHFFGRGVGKRKMKKLIDALGWEVVLTGSAEDFAQVEGFDDKTAEKIARGLGPYLDWIIPLEDNGYITIAYEDTNVVGDKMAGEKVVFTGFRDKELQDAVEAAGGTMQSSVSGKTTIVVTTNPNSNTGKIKKARGLGIKILGVDEFKEMMG
jgi:NAD-dependent DNA ligase